MTRWLFAAGTMVAAVMSASAGARANYFESGKTLYGGNLMFSDGYVIGIVDALLTGNEVNGYRACLSLPKQTAAGQMQDGVRRRLRDVVRRFLAVHPESRPLAASGLVAQALAEAFPCK
jgi:hypothetical protein